MGKKKQNRKSEGKTRPGEQKVSEQGQDLKRGGLPLREEDVVDESYGELEMEFMFLEPHEEHKDGLRQFLAAQLDNLAGNVEGLAGAIAVDPAAITVGFQDQNDHINICSVTALVSAVDLPQLWNYFETKATKHGIEAELGRGNSFVLLNNRILNTPPRLALEIYRQLEVPKAAERVVLFSKATKEKGGRKKRNLEGAASQNFEELVYPRFEEYLFMKHASQKGCFSSSGRDGAPFVRLIAVMTRKEFIAAVQEQAQWVE